jgi:hypothetical protein
LPGLTITMPDVTITIDEDGSYIVDGDCRLNDDDGRELDLPYDVQLCRTPRSTSMERSRTDQRRTSQPARSA